MSSPVVTDQARRLGARAALHVFRADVGPIEDPAELLGQLLAGLREEALAAASGSDRVWKEAVEVMFREWRRLIDAGEIT